VVVVSEAVALTDVAAHYDGHPALRGVNLRVGRGETVGVIGRNGAGKTTLFHVLMGLRPLSEGTARVCGFDVSDRGEARRIRRAVGIVFQRADDQLFSGTVSDDVAFGPLNLGLDDDTVRHRVKDALERVGAAHTAERISHHLSAGEKRRVAIATALAMAPELLILDEPTSELDPQGRRAVIELLGTLEHGKLIASHDLEFVLETCPRVVVLDAGRVVADGPARERLADAALMARTGLEVPYSLR
jgi:cobalt/nickel transport system ATP-binding protein